MLRQRCSAPRGGGAARSPARFPHHPPLFIRQVPSSRRSEKFVNFFLRRVTCPRNGGGGGCAKGRVLIKTCRVSIRIDVTPSSSRPRVFLSPPLCRSSLAAGTSFRTSSCPRPPYLYLLSGSLALFPRQTCSARRHKKFPIRPGRRVQITRTPVMKCK